VTEAISSLPVLKADRQKEIASPSPLPKGVRGLSVARNDREAETLIYQSQNRVGSLYRSPLFGA
jgi:hypothetical protein